MQLSPCRFCGSPALLATLVNGSNERPPMTVSHYIACDSCQILTPYFLSQESAKNCWESRNGKNNPFISGEE